MTTCRFALSNRPAVVYDSHMGNHLRAYKFRFYPTQAQRRQLAIDFGHARWVWNQALAIRSTFYRRFGESVTGVDVSRDITFLKTLPAYAWLKDANSTCLVQKLRDQDAAFAAFFAGRARYPRFKKRHHAQAIRYQLDQRQIHRTFDAQQKLLRLPKLGALKLKWSRTPAGIPKMATVRLDSAGRYWVTLAIEERVETLPARTGVVGLDLGVKDLVVDSNGGRYPNPRHLNRHLKRLRKANRSLARKVKGSNRWHRARLRLARCHAKVRNTRTDALHQLTTTLIRENQAICVESLHVKGMVRNRRLARHIADAGFGELVRQLEYKAAWYGRTLISIDQWFPSTRTCGHCGVVNDQLTLKDRSWTCPGCGTDHDRDLNAAQNILVEGLKQYLPAGSGKAMRVEGDTHRPPVAVPNRTPPASDEARIGPTPESLSGTGATG